MFLEIISNNKNCNIRTINKNGKAYFGATDIAKALGYKNPIKAIKDHCRRVEKYPVQHPQSKTKTVLINMIPEGDIIRLAVRSELPGAKEFESWIFDEVIPQIMKTGRYEAKGKIPVLGMKRSDI